jgi:hypothetical protein
MRLYAVPGGGTMQIVTDLLFSHDMLIAVIGAVIGSLLLSLFAALFWASPRWFSNLRTWWANRSKKSAEKRANQLRDELQKIDELRKDLSRYVGFLIGDIATALFALSCSIVFF